MLPKERVINFKDEELAVVSGAYNFLGKNIFMNYQTAKKNFTKFAITK